MQLGLSYQELSFAVCDFHVNRLVLKFFSKSAYLYPDFLSNLLYCRRSKVGLINFFEKIVATTI